MNGKTLKHTKQAINKPKKCTVHHTTEEEGEIYRLETSKKQKKLDLLE